jgi:hypothetical protein
MKQLINMIDDRPFIDKKYIFFATLKISRDALKRFMNSMGSDSLAFSLIMIKNIPYHLEN